VCVPVFAAVAVYLAVGHWNSWFDVLIYNPKGQWDTLQVYLRRILLESEAAAKVSEVSNAESKLRNMTSESVRAATTIVVTVPILLVYPFFQKYFISGITIGSVKQ
jgi:putative aldouronate transport system permease protein